MAIADKNRKLIGLILTIIGTIASTYLSPENAQVVSGLLASAYAVFVGGNMYEHAKKSSVQPPPTG